MGRGKCIQDALETRSRRINGRVEMNIRISAAWRVGKRGSSFAGEPLSLLSSEKWGNRKKKRGGEEITSRFHLCPSLGARFN